jgi:hypothetical protein
MSSREPAGCGRSGLPIRRVEKGNVAVPGALSLASTQGRIYLVFVYAKNEATTLTAAQKSQLREIATKIRIEV